MRHVVYWWAIAELIKKRAAISESVMFVPARLPHGFNLGRLNIIDL